MLLIGNPHPTRGNYPGLCGGVQVGGDGALHILQCFQFQAAQEPV